MVGPRQEQHRDSASARRRAPALIQIEQNMPQTETSGHPLADLLWRFFPPSTLPRRTLVWRWLSLSFASLRSISSSWTCAFLRWMALRPHGRFAHSNRLGGTFPSSPSPQMRSRDDRDVCLQAGMDGFLSKPVSLAALRAEIERVTSTSFSTLNPVGPVTLSEQTG